MLTTLTLATLLSGTIILDDGPHEHSVDTRMTQLSVAMIIDFPHLGRKELTVQADEAQVDGTIHVSRDPYHIQWDGIAVEYRGARLSETVSFPIWTGTDWFDATATLTLTNHPTVNVAAYAANLIPIRPGLEDRYAEQQPVLSGTPVSIDWSLTGPVSTLTGSYTFGFEANPVSVFGWMFTVPIEEVPDSWWTLWQAYSGQRSLPILFEGKLDGVQIRLTGVDPSFRLWWTPEPSTTLLGLLGALALLRPISARRRR